MVLRLPFLSVPEMLLGTGPGCWLLTGCHVRLPVPSSSLYPAVIEMTKKENVFPKIGTPWKLGWREVSCQSWRAEGSFGVGCSLSALGVAGRPFRREGEKPAPSCQGGVPCELHLLRRLRGNEAGHGSALKGLSLERPEEKGPRGGPALPAPQKNTLSVL